MVLEPSLSLLGLLPLALQRCPWFTGSFKEKSPLDCQALIPQLNRNILNIRISTLQSEENQTSTQLHLGLVADAGKEEQEQSKLLMCASDSLKLATWAAF